MTPNEYQQLAARTMPSTDPVKSGLHGVLGLQDETYEFIDSYEDFVSWDIMKSSKKYQDMSEMEKKFFDEEYEGRKTHCLKELGDIWWMIAEICTANQILLSDVLDAIYLDELIETYPRAAARLAGIYQKHFQGHEIDVEKVVQLLADFIAYLEFALDGFGSRQQIWEMNIEKLRARYPDGFDPEKSLHRAEGDI